MLFGVVGSLVAVCSAFCWAVLSLFDVGQNLQSKASPLNVSMSTRDLVERKNHWDWMVSVGV